MNTSAFGIEKGTTIRTPSTANLMIDSRDRDENVYSSPWDFQIVRNQALMNGSFTRIGTTEVVMEWRESNIQGASGLKNNTITFDLSGIAPNTYSGTQTVQLFEDNYTIAECLDSIVSNLNDLSGTTGMTFSIRTAPKPVSIVVKGGWAEVQEGTLADQLDITVNAQETVLNIIEPDLRPYRYLDIVSPQLTYCQDLKDNSTATTSKDVLCRWYFAFDEQNMLDKYGFPILMGYTQFVTRRIYNPPKQIKWDNIQPVGNVSFQVYDENGDLVKDNFTSSEWLMTLQFSEN